MTAKVCQNRRPPPPTVFRTLKNAIFRKKWPENRKVDDFGPKIAIFRPFFRKIAVGERM